jgi:hypothetical protein
VKRSRRILTILVPVLLFAGLEVGLTSASTQAASYTQTITKYYNLAMNRSGGGTGNGTKVIAWNSGDPNDDISFFALGDMCNSGGYVTATCPFPLGSGLNLGFEGDQIVALWSPKTGKCVGTNSAGDISAVLQPCPHDDGTSGGWSTISVLQYADTVGSNNYYILVNKNWSTRQFQSSSCYEYTCALVVGANSGYNQPLSMGVGDANVFAADFAAAQSYDQWTEALLNGSPGPALSPGPKPSPGQSAPTGPAPTRTPTASATTP